MTTVVSLLSVAAKVDVCREVFATQEENRPLTTASMDSSVCHGAAGKVHALT